MVRDRLLADPRFLFLVVAEMAIDTGAVAVPHLLIGRSSMGAWRCCCMCRPLVVLNALPVYRSSSASWACMLNYGCCRLRDCCRGPQARR